MDIRSAAAAGSVSGSKRAKAAEGTSTDDFARLLAASNGGDSSSVGSVGSSPRSLAATTVGALLSLTQQVGSAAASKDSASATDSGTPAASKSSSHTVNLHNATLGDVFNAAQANGLGKVMGYLETMSTNTDGSSAVAHVFQDKTKYDIPKLLDQWAQFDSLHGAERGAQQINDIKNALLSHADQNGNITTS